MRNVFQLLLFYPFSHLPQKVFKIEKNISLFTKHEFTSLSPSSVIILRVAFSFWATAILKELWRPMKTFFLGCLLIKVLQQGVFTEELENSTKPELSV